MKFGKITILFENNDLIAVDKPPGISIHNAEDRENLIGLLTKQIKRALSPVHRLDKETSGIQVLAKSTVAAQYLAAEFEHREVQKTYVGILRGVIKEEKGIWKKPLTDKAEGRRNPQGLLKDRIPCETGFRRIKTSKYFSLCEFDLMTGRQHQIRKHTAVADHALVGDPRYGEPRYNQKIAEIYKHERMFLHCTKIELLGQTIESRLPQSFESLFQ